SSKVETVMKRRPADVGLYLRIGISDHHLSRSRSLPAKAEQRKDAGGARGQRLRVRPRTQRCDRLQPQSEHEMRRWRPPYLDLGPREDLDRSAGLQLHDRLLPTRLRALLQ